MPPWAIAAAVVLALLPAAWLGAQRIFDGDESAPDGHATELPIPAVSPSASPGTSPTAEPTPPAARPTATPTRRPAPAPLPTSSPRRLVAGDLIDAGFDSAVPGIEATSTSELARWAERGSPGSPGTDTVYVTGRVLPGGAFEALPDLDVGATVTIRTDEGELDYTVRSTGIRPHDGLLEDASFSARKPGRLILVGLRYDDRGDPLPGDLVVVAELTGVEPA